MNETPLVFDPVHDTQTVHRALIVAFSYPGTPVAVEPASRTSWLGLPEVLGAVALTLLDPETTFFTSALTALTGATGARRSSEAEAAFILLPVWDEEAWCQAFERARRGTLADPHLGATIIAYSPQDTPSTVWTASGPGLEFPVQWDLPGSGPWVDVRNAACAEFPLGVDLILVREKDLIAIPRTTQVVRFQGRGV